MNDEFWEVACGSLRLWHALTIVNVVFLLLLLASLPFLDRDSGSFVAAVLSFVVIGTYLVLYAVVRRQCIRRESYRGPQ